MALKISRMTRMLACSVRLMRDSLVELVTLPVWDFSRKASTLHLESPSTASAKAAAEAEKTEALSGDFTPVPTVMPSANRNSSTPPASADGRVKRPTISAAPRHVSATVTNQTMAGTALAGAQGLSVAAYAAKRPRSPHATFGVPAGPHIPNRSLTAERNVAPSASRKNSATYTLAA